MNKECSLKGSLHINTLIIHCGNHLHGFILIYYNVPVSNTCLINRVTFTSLSAGVSKKKKGKKQSERERNQVEINRVIRDEEGEHVLLR